LDDIKLSANAAPGIGAAPADVEFISSDAEDDDDDQDKDK
jgi:hypothetical protein